jgi:predicted RND superfamily exporter protein
MAGVFKLTSNASYLVYFDKDTPLVKQYLDIKQRFNSNDSLILVLKSNDGRPLIKQPRFYQHSKSLIKILKQLPEVTATNSFLTELRWRSNLFALGNPKTQFLSADGTHALIYIDVKLVDNSDAKQILAFNSKVLALANNSYLTQINSNTETTTATPAITFYLSGALGLNNAYIQTVRHDLKLFIPFLFFSMLFALIFLLRNVKIAFSMLGIGLLATLGSFGVIGWLGYPLASINIFTPIMIIGLSVVTNMHNTLAFYQYIAAKKDKRSALSLSFKENLIPLTMSCLTTALGFLFLLNSSSPPIVVTGIASALGIIFSLLLSLTLYQKALFISATNTLNTTIVSRFSDRISRAKQHLTHQKFIVMSCIAFLCIGLLGLTKLSINDNVYQYFPEDYDFRKSLSVLNDKFNGVVSIDYVIAAHSQTKMSISSGMIRSTQSEHTPLDQWTDQHWMKLANLLEKITNIAQVKQINPPESLLNRHNLKQIYNTDFTSKSPLSAYIDKRDHKIRIQVRLSEMSSRQLLAIDQQITHWDTTDAALFTTDKDGINKLTISRGTSPDILFANVGYYNAISMFSSLGLALTIISAITGFILKSWRLCAVVFICNFFPIVVAYGLLGLSGGYLTLGSTVVIGMIIGIIVDDTLHLLFKFVKYRQQNNNILAIEKLQKRVFPAVIISSFIIVLALSIGLVSDFKPTFEISFFSILVISLALITDILLLPILLKSRWISPQSIVEDKKS